MRPPGPVPDALLVIPDESSLTFPDPVDVDRALRRDLVLLTAQRRARRRGRRPRWAI
jgi:hypothetical protein